MEDNYHKRLIRFFQRTTTFGIKFMTKNLKIGAKLILVILIFSIKIRLAMEDNYNKQLVRFLQLTTTFGIKFLTEKSVGKITPSDKT